MVMPPETVIRRSAQDVPSITAPEYAGDGFGGSASELHLFSIATFADEIAPWGVMTRLRDVQLREFLPTETHLASAFATVAARNSAFAWKIDGGPRQVQRAQRILQYASFGRGWRDFVTRFTLDLIGQDNGAFIEFIREADRPTAKVIGIANLDAGRCWRTGDPRNPVLYTDLKGGRHLMPWWRVAALTETPSNIERLRGIQYSAQTRALAAAQYFRDIHQFQREKMSGRRPRAIHFVNGVAADKIADALRKQEAWANNKALYRYMEPLIVEGLKPSDPVSTATIDLANLPDNFNALEAWNMYIDGLAMALLLDRQDLAPLSGGNIGTSTQSQVLAQKTRGKGPALFMKLIEDLFNFYEVLGPDCVFSFDEQDLTQEQDQATVDKLKAEGRKLYVDAGILNTQIVRQQMVDDGDLDEEYLAMLNEQDVTDESTGTDEAPIETQAEVDTGAVADATSPAPSSDGAGALQLGARARKDPAIDAMDGVEAEAKRKFRDALAGSRESFRRAVRKGVPAEAKVVKEVKAIAADASTALTAHTDAVVEAQAEATRAVRATVEMAAAAQAESIAQSAQTQAAALAAQAKATERVIEAVERTNSGTVELAEAIRELARPKRRRVIKDDAGRIVGTEEE